LFATLYGAKKILNRITPRRSRHGTSTRQSSLVELYEPFPSRLTVSSTKCRIASPFDFTSFQQSFYDGVNRREEIFLRRQAQSLNSASNFCGVERFFCGPENCSHCVGNAFYQPANSRRSLIRFRQFMQGSHSLFLLCYLRFKVYAGTKQTFQLSECLDKIGFVFIRHRRI